MVSGYEKSPDYGGIEPSRTKLVLVWLAVLLAVVIGLWLVF